MKKKLLLLFPVSFLVCSCSFLDSIFGKNKKTQEPTVVPGETTIIDDIEPEDVTQHATNISADPNAPFYLKVGETRNISVSLSPSPTLASEKVFTWKKNGNNIDYVVDEEKTNKVSVTGLSEGVVELTATNTYNENLTKTFTIKVIDFNEENDYLWQYKSSDRAQFGYDNTEDLKKGLPEGDAVLNGMTWHFTRSRVTSLQSSMGAVGFGKGGEPEEHIHLETTTDRLVNKFTIEAGSARSLAKMTIKVNDTVYMDNKTVPKPEYDVIQTMESDMVLPTYGKIEIDIITPAYNAELANSDPSYKIPGAFYLKSILINFKQEVIDRIQFAEDSKHKTDYFVGEIFTLDGMKLQKHTTRDVLIDVDVEAELDAGTLTFVASNLDTADHVAKDVRLSLSVEGYETPFELVYQIHVRDTSWLPTSIAILGTMENQLLVEGDEIDYSGLSIKVVYDEPTQDYMYCPFEESETFTFTYGVDGDPFVAEKVMESGYTITVIGYFVPVDGVMTQTVATYFDVPSGKLSITEAIYDRIDFRRASTYQKLVDAGLKKDGAPLSYTYEKTNRVRLDFDKVSKGNRLSDNKELPKTLSNFYITILDTSLSIDKLNIEFAKVSSKENNYRLFSSIYGGDVYGDQLTQAENNKIVHGEFPNNTNNLLLAPGLTSTGSTVNANTGIASILIRYVEMPHVNYSISYGETSPTKVDYQEGEVFDPTGLTVTLTEEGGEHTFDITSYVKWYDGSTYSSAPQETLLPASTYVVGVFHDKTIQVEINSVAPLSVHVQRVLSVDEITAEGRYYITCPAVRLILLGSTKNSDIFKAVGSTQVEDLSFGLEMELNILLENDYITITPLENGKFMFQTRTGAQFGLTASGGGDGTVAADRPFHEFDVIIDEDGLVHASVTANFIEAGEEKEVTYYIGCNESNKNFKLYNQDKQNVVLYKVV